MINSFLLPVEKPREEKYKDHKLGEETKTLCKNVCLYNWLVYLLATTDHEVRLCKITSTPFLQGWEIIDKLLKKVIGWWVWHLRMSIINDMLD